MAVHWLLQGTVKLLFLVQVNFSLLQKYLPLTYTLWSVVSGRFVFYFLLFAIILRQSSYVRVAGSVPLGSL